MNKTISINLGGSVFNIEEDAFIMLQHYLESIKSNFDGDPASAEIMSDIEVRIAEIFRERNNDQKNVVIKADVEHMMSVMGRPEDYRMDDGEEKKNTRADHSYTSGSANPRRKIFRDTDDAVIAGVCSGLSHYFKVDPLVIRLIMVVLTIASIGFPGVLGYIIFWALVPPASTTAEKLRMRGEHVNIENIGRFVNDEAKSAAERMSKFGKSASQNMGQHTSDFVRVLGKVGAVIFGFIFVSCGLGLLIGIVAMLAFSEMDFFGFDGNNWDTMNQVIFGNDGTLYLLIIGLVLAMGAPAIALLYSGIKLMTGSAKKIKGIGISLFSLFIMGVLMCIYGGVKTGRQFTNDAEINTSFIYTQEAGDTLHIDVKKDNVFVGRTSSHDSFSNLVKMDDQFVYYGNPVYIEFEPTTSSAYKVVAKKRSQGMNMEQAGKYASSIEYNFTANGDSLLLDPWFTTPKADLYRGQQVHIIVYVPIGKYVDLGENTSLITWRGNEPWPQKMTEDGFENDDDRSETNIDVTLDSPNIKVTDDSVFFKSGDIEIKTKRDN